ncbi:MAG: sulfite exporter TauE/SafE family protein [Clostridia bacterium]|nr:sulfite exporter TauE/SafE family protein [Clostridia bacterium]
MKKHGKITKYVLLCAAGAVGGTVNGLLGSGAGIVLIYALARLYPEKENREIFTLSLATVFFLSLCSAVFYGAEGRYSVEDFLPYALPAAVGGAGGSFLLSRLNARVLKKVFSALLIISGILMLR